MLQQQLQQPQQPQQPPPSPQQQCILFYKYFVLSISTAQRAALAEEQRALCEACGLRGRLRVACEGLNGTLAGNHEGTAAYIGAMERDARHRFAGIDWKSADSVEAAECFGGDLQVRETEEVVSSGGTLTGVGLSCPASRLSPRDFHAKLTAPGAARDLVLVDVRNGYESAVGRFEVPGGCPAIAPGTRTFGQFRAWVERTVAARATSEGDGAATDAPAGPIPPAAWEALQPERVAGKAVLMYCTGGVRCEKASACVRELLDRQHAALPTGTAPEATPVVFQLEGGIHRYLEAFPDGGCFRGKNFVFDRRTTVSPLRPQGEVIVGRCAQRGCGAPWDEHSDTHRCAACRVLVLVCPECDAAYAPPPPRPHAAGSDGEAAYPHGFYCEEHAFLGDTSADALLQVQAKLESGLAALQRAGQQAKHRRRSARRLLGWVGARLLELGDQAVRARHTLT